MFAFKYLFILVRLKFGIIIKGTVVASLARFLTLGACLMSKSLIVETYNVVLFMLPIGFFAERWPRWIWLQALE